MNITSTPVAQLRAGRSAGQLISRFPYVASSYRTSIELWESAGRPVFIVASHLLLSLRSRAAWQVRSKMNIEQTVERFIADFEKARDSRASYFWREAFESALVETEPSRRLKSIEFAEVVLYGRRQQLQEFANELDALQELDALKVAIERLRSASWPMDRATLTVKFAGQSQHGSAKF
jgi:hypothetical protein